MELKQVLAEKWGRDTSLLIVPYGIETLKALSTSLRSRLTFNRTLWN